MEYHFFCQNPRCRKPLDIDETLYDIDLDMLRKEGLTELEEKLKQYEHMLAISDGNSENTPNNSSTPKTTTPNGDTKPKDSPAQSIRSMERIKSEPNVSLPQVTSPVSQTYNPHASLSQASIPVTQYPLLQTPKNQKTLFLSKLFEISSDLTLFDQPMCKECTHKQIKSLETQVAEAIKENASYKSFLKKLDADRSKMVSEEELDNEIQKLECEETQLREQLKKVEEEREQLKNEMELLKSESDSIRRLENSYWANYNNFQDELQAFQDESDAVKMKLHNAQSTLDRLKITNIFNDTFHIWHDGHFGTINNFRLGRLPSQPVDWNEINAAWGQAVQLLHTIGKKLNFQFTTYRLIPMGSNSKVERISDNSSYELFGSSDISLGRLFWYRRFDNGMVAFLHCLKELGDYAESKDKTFKLPYKIDKDKISDMSIKIQFNNEETWTKSLKYLLTNLKWLLTWVSKQPDE